MYYEPVKVRETRGYWAVARVQNVMPDPEQSKMFYALIEPGSFLQFTDPVAFVEKDGPVERGLLNGFGKLSGRAQAAVRPLSQEDFIRIVNAGLPDDDLLPRIEPPFDPTRLREDRLGYDLGERTRVAQLTLRPLRDRAFRKSVLNAYGERCALTGLKLINGGGRAEVEAAHIRSVEANGPDLVANGLALSGTVHWMFDRGLITLANDLSIRVSSHVNDRNGIAALINKDGKARMPLRAADRPHPIFLEWHRDACFKA